MSVLRDIRGALEALIEGTAAGGIAMPTIGDFQVVGDDHQVQQADAADPTPRPVYVEAGRAVSDPTLPSDVTGSYRWKARAIPIWVPYAFNPEDDPTERDGVMDDDEDTLEHVLKEPLNLALTAGWAKCDVTVSRETGERDADGVVAIRWLLLTATVAYREDWTV